MKQSLRMKKSITLAPANLNYIEYLGEFYFRRGEREKAVKNLESPC